MCSPVPAPSFSTFEHSSGVSVISHLLPVTCHLQVLSKASMYNHVSSISWAEDKSVTGHLSAQESYLRIQRSCHKHTEHEHASALILILASLARLPLASLSPQIMTPAAQRNSRTHETVLEIHVGSHETPCVRELEQTVFIRVSARCLLLFCAGKLQRFGGIQALRATLPCTSEGNHKPDSFLLIAGRRRDTRSEEGDC